MKTIILITLGALLLSACSEKEKSPEDKSPELPVVITLNATDVQSDVAVLSGEVISESDLVTARGFCWSSLPEPGLDDSVTYCNSGNSKYSDTLTGLSPSKSYFYRAFATNSVGTAYGAEKSFITAERIPFSGTFAVKRYCHERDEMDVLLDDSLSCAEYSYDASTHILHITHFNAGLNCCAMNPILVISLSNDTIYIQESDDPEEYCYCLCLHDLTMEIHGVYAESYIVRFIEPYCGTDPPLIFTIDLATNVSGTECVIRHKYPWGYPTP